MSQAGLETLATPLTAASGRRGTVMNSLFWWRNWWRVSPLAVPFAFVRDRDS